MYILGHKVKCILLYVDHCQKSFKTTNVKDSAQD